MLSSSVIWEKSEFQGLEPIWRSVFKNLAPSLLSSLQFRGKGEEHLLWDHACPMYGIGPYPAFDSSEHLRCPNAFLIHVQFMGFLIHSL